MGTYSNCAYFWGWYFYALRQPQHSCWWNTELVLEISKVIDVCNPWRVGGQPMMNFMLNVLEETHDRWIEVVPIRIKHSNMAVWNIVAMQLSHKQFFSFVPMRKWRSCYQEIFILYNNNLEIFAPVPHKSHSVT